MLRKISEPFIENGVWKIRRNDELQQLYGEHGILYEIQMTRVRWVDYQKRITDERIPKKKGISGQTKWKMPKGKPQKL